MPNRLLEIQKELFIYHKNMVESLIRENISNQETVELLQDFFEPLKGLLRKSIWFRQLSNEQKTILDGECKKIDNLSATFDAISEDARISQALEVMEEISQLTEQSHEIMKPRWTGKKQDFQSENRIITKFYVRTLNKDENIIREVLMSIIKMAPMALEYGLLSEDIPNSASATLSLTLDQLKRISPVTIEHINKSGYAELTDMLLAQIQNVK